MNMYDDSLGQLRQDSQADPHESQPWRREWSQ
jgi:hypothetical protein